MIWTHRHIDVADDNVLRCLLRQTIKPVFGKRGSNAEAECAGTSLPYYNKKGISPVECMAAIICNTQLLKLQVH